MKRYNLYPNLLLTDGFTRSTLLDVSRGVIHFIPNEMAEKFTNQNFRGIKLADFEDDEQAFLLEKDLIFEVDSHNADSFPRISLKWDYPAKITNLIIELSEITANHIGLLHDFDAIAHFNIVLNSFTSADHIHKIILFLAEYECDSTEFTLLENINTDVVKQLETQLVGLKKCVVINNWANYEIGSVENQADDHYGSRMLDLNNSALPIELAKNLVHFSEAQEHHTYFNRKLVITSTGEIKNALEDNYCFGTIQNLTCSNELTSIIDSPRFKENWFVKKTETDVCKDCEFKYMCVDNRLPVQRKKEQWFHKTNCGYNPYIAKWEGQENYLPLTKTGITSNINGFNIDLAKIEKINASLWAD